MFDSASLVSLRYAVRKRNYIHRANYLVIIVMSTNFVQQKSVYNYFLYFGILFNLCIYLVCLWDCGSFLDFRKNISRKMHFEKRKFCQFCSFVWNSKIVPAKTWKTTNPWKMSIYRKYLENYKRLFWRNLKQTNEIINK